MTRVRLVSVAAVLAMLALRNGRSAGPRERTASDRASDLAATLMSPYCPGMTLATCPSLAAVELRRDISERIAAGESEMIITSDLLNRFGEVGLVRGNAVTDRESQWSRQLRQDVAGRQPHAD